MLQQQSAIYQARSFALNNGSVDLHRYMVDTCLHGYMADVKLVSTKRGLLNDLDLS